WRIFYLRKDYKDRRPIFSYALNRQFAAHRLDPFLNSQQPKTIMSLCRIETASVVAQFQANRLRIENKMDLEVTGTSVPERIGQDLLANAQKVLLPFLRQWLRFTLNSEFGTQARAHGHLPHQFLHRSA